MSDRKDKHREAYKEEAYELLNELEESLLELEADPGDKNVIGRVFRAMHTIKGSGSMFGFDEIAAFAHEVENVFDLVRNGLMGVTKDLINATLEARDQIKEMLDLSGSEGASADEARSKEILRQLKSLVPGEALLKAGPEERGASPVAAQAAGPVSAASGAAGEAKALDAPDITEYTYRIFFKPKPDIFLMGTNPGMLIEDLRQMGRAHVMADSAEVPLIDDLDPESCYLSWNIILTTDRPMQDVRSVFMFVEDECELKIDLIDEGGIGSSEQIDYKKLGEILIERGRITKEDIEGAARKQRRLGELLVDSGAIPSGEVQAALAEQQHIKDLRMQRQARDLANTVRVPADKLDRLVNLVGELVTVQARLSQTTLQRKDPELLGISEEIERLSAELHDNAMNIRMVPIGSTFSKFRRLVRDLSGSLRRDVALLTEGADTELDKTVIDRLNDPLVHIIRNCIDHGIEPPEVRLAAGKARQGQIKLSASHSGADVLIVIKDDGYGIDRDRVLAKATQRGLVKPDEPLQDHEVYGLIFAPGFSTAERVTDVSGRGVGMDVVKRSIDALRGTVEVESAKGRGTTITLRIPLTLAIIDGLLVAVGEARYVVPLSMVEECVELREADMAAAYGRSMVNVRGDLVPYINMRECFEVNGSRPRNQQVVVLNSEGMRVGFAVDNVIGEHQTVIKTLGRVYRGVRSVSGATILGDGSVALILDAAKIIDEEIAKERLRVESIGAPQGMQEGVD